MLNMLPLISIFVPPFPKHVFLSMYYLSACSVTAEIPVLLVKLFPSHMMTNFASQLVISNLESKFKPWSHFVRLPQTSYQFNWGLIAALAVIRGTRASHVRSQAHATVGEFFFAFFPASRKTPASLECTWCLRGAGFLLAVRSHRSMAQRARAVLGKLDRSCSIDGCSVQRSILCSE